MFVLLLLLFWSRLSFVYLSAQDVVCFAAILRILLSWLFRSCLSFLYMHKMSLLLLFYVFCCRGCSGLVCPFYICTRCLFCCCFTCFVVACVFFVLSIPAQGVAGIVCPFHTSPGCCRYCLSFPYQPRVLPVLSVLSIPAQGVAGIVCPFHTCPGCCRYCLSFPYLPRVLSVLSVLSIPAQSVAGFELKALEHPQPGSLVPGKQVPSLHTQFCLSLC